MIGLDGILNLAAGVVGLGTKAIKPDSVRERNSIIKSPKEIQEVKNWIAEDGVDRYIEKWVAQIKTFDLPQGLKNHRLTQRELILYVSNKIKWGAIIDDIRKTPNYVQLDYSRDGICYPTEEFKLRGK